MSKQQQSTSSRHIPLELKLLIADNCTWNTILSLRLANKSWFSAVQHTLAHGTISSFTPEAGRWYNTTPVDVEVVSIIDSVDGEGEWEKGSDRMLKRIMMCQQSKRDIDSGKFGRGAIKR